MGWLAPLLHISGWISVRRQLWFGGVLQQPGRSHDAAVLLPAPSARLHVDMDAFFASVEELDQPALVSSWLVGAGW